MKKQKLFIVRKYVWAKDAQEALKKEKRQSAQDCWIDEDWKKASNEPKDSIGFYHER